ncbi:MAG: hypothetical protein CSA54_00370, partial [Gammaproteobacteria bacterium]
MSIFRPCRHAGARKPASSTSLRTLLLALPLALTSVTAVAESPVPEHLWSELTLADARHFLHRTGFGASADELRALVGQSRRHAIDQLIDDLTEQPLQPYLPIVDEPAPRSFAIDSLPTKPRQAFRAARQQELDDLRLWWVREMLMTDSPQTERLVLFWHDHFASAIDDLEDRGFLLARQNRVFREHVGSNWRDFLKAMIREPALLDYLDNDTSYAEAPNENLARELLELFTLGEGNYPESVVRQAALALTGYSLNTHRDYRFVFDRRLRHDGETELFGVTAVHDGDALIDRILAQPKAARHLTERYWRAFVSETNIDDAAIDDIAAAFRDSDYDLPTLYRAIFESEAFWDPANRASIVKSPAQLFIGLARSLDYPKHEWKLIPAMMAATGMQLFNPPNVAGWKEGEPWLRADRLIQRQHGVRLLLAADGNADTADDDLMLAEGDANMMMTESTDNGMMMAEGTDGGMMMAAGADTAMMSPSAAGSDSNETIISLELAGDAWQGDPRYTVSLRDDSGKPLWQSAAADVTWAIDGSTLGQSMFEEDLWQRVEFTVPAVLADKGRELQVSFVNDLADERGDRNFYVRKVRFGQQELALEDASQVDDCEGRSVTGQLYCNGTLSLPIAASERAVSTLPTGPDTEPSASAIRPYDEPDTTPGEEQLRLLVENLRAGDTELYNLVVDLHMIQGRPVMQVVSNQCWPDCMRRWPLCSGRDEQERDLRILRLDLGSDSPDSSMAFVCPLEAFDAATGGNWIPELLARLPAALDHALAVASDDDFAEIHAFWQKAIADSPATGDTPLVLVKEPDDDAEGFYTIEPPPITYPTPSALSTRLDELDSGFLELLAPGVELSSEDILSESPSENPSERQSEGPSENSPQSPTPTSKTQRELERLTAQ